MAISHLVLLVLALLATFMMAIGWLQNPTAPTPWQWFVAKVSEGGLWTGVFLSLLAVVYLGWRRSRARDKAQS